MATHGLVKLKGFLTGDEYSQTMETNLKAPVSCLSGELELDARFHKNVQTFLN